MKEIKDGGPAFPLVAQNWHREGMSLRDYFAAKAMHSLIVAEGHNEDCARFAYLIADEMLKARDK